MLVQRLAKQLGCLAAIFFMLDTASFAAAELIVIFDNGQARLLSDFLGPLDSGKPDKAPKVHENFELGAADVSLLLPIRSPGLTPGKITPRVHNVPFAGAFFLIGSDAISKRWLKKYRKLLKEMGAVGLLVEATTLEDLRAIAELADGLPITPASGSDIAKALGIRHYPVGISSGRLWQ